MSLRIFEELTQDLERIEVEFGAAVLRLSTLFANRVSSRREVLTDEVTEQLRLIRQLFRDQQHITSLLVSRWVAVMAGVGGNGAPAAFVVGPIQAQVATCANVDAFDALYAGNAHAPARRAMEGFGMVHPDAGVRLSATQKRQTHQEHEIRNLQAGLAAANTAANNAAAAANAARAVAQAAGNADRFRPANPPKYGNKEKDPDVRQWLSVVEDYLRTCPDNDYLRLASSYLEGGPRMLWQSRYEAYRAGRAALPDPEPPIPRQFFRQDS